MVAASKCNKEEVFDKVGSLFDEVVYSILKKLDIEETDNVFMVLCDMIHDNAEFEQLLIELGRE